MGNNTASISALVSAISGGLTKGQTYDLMRQIADDLSSITDTVTGVSTALRFTDTGIVIDPEFIASPGDLPQLVSSPGRVAFTNWENIFIKNQTIKKDEAELILETEQGSNAGRLVMLGDSSVMLSENVDWDGSTLSGVGFFIQLTSNELFLNSWSGAVTNQYLKIDATGRVLIGTPGFTTGATVNEVVLQNNKSIRSSNAAAGANIQMIGVDANDIIRVGANNTATGVGHFAIPDRTTANLPASGAATQDGTIVIEKGTPPNFIIYTGGLRYRVAPALATAF